MQTKLMVHSNNLNAMREKMKRKKPNSQATRRKSGKRANYTKTITSDTVDKLRTNKAFVRYFPELKIAANISTAYITSPDTFTNTLLHFDVDTTLPMPNIIAGFIDTVKTTDAQLGIENSIDNIIVDAIIGSGGTLKIILPQSTIDAIIYDVARAPSNSKMESLLNKTNKLSKISMEGFDTSADISIVHNLDSLKADILNQKTASNEAITTLEAVNDYNGIRSQDVSNMLFALDVDMKAKKKPEEGGVIDIDISPNLTGVYGRTLVKTINSQSFVVIHPPGEPDNPIGYLIVLQDGHPITNTTRKKKSKSKHKAINKISQEVHNINDTVTDDNTLLELYSQKMIDKLESELNTATKMKVEVGDNSMLFDTLLTNALAGSKIELVYVPEACATYFNLEVRENGLGKTKLEDLHPILTMRTQLLISKQIANVRANLDVTNIDVVLDPKILDVEEALADIQDLIIANSSQKMPGARNTHESISEWMASNRYNVRVTGHADLPATSIEYSTTKTEVPQSDDRLEKELQEKTINAMGVLPSMLAEGYSADFASEAEAQRQLFLKNPLASQRRINKQLTDFFRKYLRLNSRLLDQITEIIETNKREAQLLFKPKDRKNFSDQDLVGSVLDFLLAKLTVTLPVPVVLSKLKQELFESYMENIESTLEILLSPDSMDVLLEKLRADEKLSGEYIDALSPDSVMQLAKAYFAKSWLLRHDHQVELASMLNTDEDSLFTEELLTSEGNLESLLIKLIKSNKSKVEEEVEEETPPTEEETPPTEEETLPDDGTDDLGL